MTQLKGKTGIGRRLLGKTTCVAVAALLANASATAGEAALAQAPQGDVSRKALIVCADPSNLPYSNKAREGFENRIADVLAADLKIDVDYFWFSGHRSFMRRTLLDRVCDVVISAPQGLPGVVTTRPFFTSSYTAVMRAGDARRFTSFDDPWLKEAKIGLQLVGNEGATTPPALALARRGANEHITGFAMWADDSDPTPQGRIVDAVANGEIDIAFVWGPFAGFFAKKHGAALRLDPITSDPGRPEVSFVFPMAVAVRKAETAFRDRLQEALDRHAPEIAAILSEAGVPLVAAPPAEAAAATSQAPAR